MEAKVPHRLRRRVASEVSAIFQASGLVEAKKLLAELSARWLMVSGKVRRLMREDIAGPQGASSRPMWETLEGMVREKAQEFIQQIMEEEVTELLGREKSERRSTVDSAEG